MLRPQPPEMIEGLKNGSRDPKGALVSLIIDYATDADVPGLAAAGSTTEKMAVVVRESRRVQQQLEKEDNRLQEVWAKVDADNSLSLDKDELRLVLIEMGWEEKEVTDEAVDEMMAVIDADGSGDVDFEEL